MSGIEQFIKGIDQSQETSGADHKYTDDLTKGELFLKNKCKNTSGNDYQH